MLHALIYLGSFELNFANLEPGTSEYISTDGSTRAHALRPPSVDGLVIGYMERTGKKFWAVRLQFEERDIILRTPVALDRMRHLGSRRFTAAPIILTDDLVSVLLDDILAANPEQQAELALLI